MAANRARRRRQAALTHRTAMGIILWIVLILVIAALLKYLLTDSGKK